MAIAKPAKFLRVCGQGRRWGICLDDLRMCPWWRLSGRSGKPRLFSTYEKAQTVTTRAEKRIAEAWPRFVEALYWNDFYIAPERINPETFWKPGGGHEKMPAYILHRLLDDVLTGV